MADPQKERRDREERRRKAEIARKKREEERRKQEQRAKEELLKKEREARKKEQERLRREEQKRRLAEERRKEKEAQRYHAPPRHSIEFRIGAGQASYNPYATQLVKNLYTGMFLGQSQSGGGGGTTNNRWGTVKPDTKARMRSFGLRYTWNDFFAEIQFEKLSQEHSYYYVSTETDPTSVPPLQSYELGSLQASDPTIEMSSAALGWSFWEAPALRLSAVLGARKELVRFAPEGLIVKQILYTTPSLSALTLPFEYGYSTKTKGAWIGLELDYDLSRVLRLRTRLSLLRQKGTGEAGNAQFEANTDFNSQLVYKPKGLFAETSFKSKGFAFFSEGSYRFYQGHSIGLRLAYRELKSTSEIERLEVYDDPASTKLAADQLIAITEMLSAVQPAYDSGYREIERSVSLYYEWRYSFL